MPKKGTTTKYKRRAGVNIGTLKTEGFAYDPPIPEDQFGGDVKALRQFKVEYKPDGTGRAKQWKGIHKNLETGKLYLATEGGERYRELTDTEYDYIVKEIGESKQLGDVEKRIGKPFRERAKDEEVIEPVEGAGGGGGAAEKVKPYHPEKQRPKKRGRPKGIQPKNSVSDAAIKEDIAYMELTNLSHPTEVEASEVIFRGIPLYEDEDGRLFALTDDHTWVASRKTVIILGKKKEIIHIRFQDFFDENEPSDTESEEEPDIPEDSDREEDSDEEEDEEEEEESEEEEEKTELGFEHIDEELVTIMEGHLIIKMLPQGAEFGGGDGGAGYKHFTTYKDERRDALSRTQNNRTFQYKDSDKDWVHRQEGFQSGGLNIESGSHLYPQKFFDYNLPDAKYYTNREDDEIYLEDDEGEERTEVGLRAMRGNRRVLIFAPSQLGTDEDQQPEMFDYETKERLGDVWDYLIPYDERQSFSEEEREDLDYFTSKAYEQIVDGYKTKSIKELEKQMREMNRVLPQHPYAYAPEYKRDLQKAINEKYTEEIVSELAEEILSGVIDESLKLKILEDLKSSISKETTDMGGGKGIIDPTKKTKMKKKKQTEAQLAALAAARERRLAKIAADKAAK